MVSRSLGGETLACLPACLCIRVKVDVWDRLHTAFPLSHGVGWWVSIWHNWGLIPARPHFAVCSPLNVWLVGFIWACEKVIPRSSSLSVCPTGQFVAPLPVVGPRTPGKLQITFLPTQFQRCKWDYCSRRAGRSPFCKWRLCHRSFIAANSCILACYAVQVDCHTVIPKMKGVAKGSNPLLPGPWELFQHGCQGCQVRNLCLGVGLCIGGLHSFVPVQLSMGKCEFS